VLVIGGAFSDCREPSSIAFQDAIPGLTAQGVRIRSLQVSGRSGPQYNARLIAAALGPGQVRPDERVVLVGYSKGAVDALQFLLDFPELRSPVVAVISVAGAIRGSPLADDGEWWYRTFFDEAFAGTCDPGDGQVVQSLRPQVREAWLDSHPLPPGIRYYSLVGIPTADQLSRALAVSWRRLADYDRRNDGQVLARDAVLPGSTVLGYVNADHWDIALDLQIPHLSVRPSTRVMPRSELLEAALLFASEDLARAQPAGASR
jgi:pimeloyl-ACP methyl ester carboxylesterase